VGIEYGHINDRGMCDWIREQFETPSQYRYTKEKKLVILDRLLWSDYFERFVAQKYPSEKRFGLEGCEALIPGMKAMVLYSII
jgi:2-oxoglutarate dehydrogenase E1 component